jgi:hypothetical protein
MLIAAGIAASLTLRESGAQHPGRGAAAAAEPGSSSGPLTTPSATAAGSRAPGRSASSAPGGHQDPLGTSAASDVASRAGVVLAAVYDLRTDRTWRLGQGQPQDEASVVKLDVLETLLAERGRTGATLSAGDQTLAGEMIEDSDNDAATSLWYEVGGASGIRSFNSAAGLGQRPGLPDRGADDGKPDRAVWDRHDRPAGRDGLGRHGLSGRRGDPGHSRFHR